MGTPATVFAASAIESTTGSQPVHRQRCAAERAVDVDACRATLLDQLRGAHEDSGRAEPALRSAARDERVDERVANRRVEPTDGRHLAPRHAERGGDARDARLAVDEHRATPALALRRASVLD